jgi:hypothetical protein
MDEDESNFLSIFIDGRYKTLKKKSYSIDYNQASTYIMFEDLLLLSELLKTHDHLLIFSIIQDLKLVLISRGMHMK